jgi:hypothetical protein
MRVEDLTPVQRVTMRDQLSAMHAMLTGIEEAVGLPCEAWQGTEMGEALDDACAGVESALMMVK